MIPQQISVWVVSIVGWIALAALGVWLLDRAIVYGLGLVKLWVPFLEFLIERGRRRRRQASPQLHRPGETFRGI